VTKQNNLMHVIILPLTESPNGGSETACRFLKPKCYSSLTNLSHKTKNFNTSRARLIINFTVRLKILLSKSPVTHSVTKISSIKSKELHYFRLNQCESHKSQKKEKKKKKIAMTVTTKEKLITEFTESHQSTLLDTSAQSPPSHIISPRIISTVY